MRGLLGVPNLVGLGIMAQCEVPLKRKRLSATLVGSKRVRLSAPFILRMWTYTVFNKSGLRASARLFVLIELLHSFSTLLLHSCSAPAPLLRHSCSAPGPCCCFIHSCFTPASLLLHSCFTRAADSRPLPHPLPLAVAASEWCAPSPSPGWG